MVHILYNELANNGSGAQTAQAASQTYPEFRIIKYNGLNIIDFIDGLNGDDSIVLCGGDGTLNRFINDIASIDVPCPVAIYKGGNGNDFLRDTNSSADGDTTIIDKFIKDLPTVTVNGKQTRFLNGIGYGIDGMVCEVANKLKARGKTVINYASLSVKLLLNGYRCPSAKVTVDGKTKTYRKVWLASAMNGRFYGGGMMVAPNQDRLSGELTCVVWHDTGKLKTLMRFPGIFNGEHIKYANMCDVISGKKICVEFSLPTALQIDGEVISGVTSYTATAPADMSTI